jgi:hypothetical protein
VVLRGREEAAAALPSVVVAADSVPRVEAPPEATPAWTAPPSSRRGKVNGEAPARGVAPAAARPASVEIRADHDDVVAGVPRRVSGQTKLVVGAVVAVAALIAIVGGLRALSQRQQSIAEAERARAVATARPEALTTSTIPPPTDPSATANGGGVAPTTGAGVAGPAGTLSTVAPNGSAPLAPEAPAPPAETAEKPLDVPPEAPNVSLVLRANRALRTGAKEKAVELARQAVKENPSDADGWLMLGAAYQASGNNVAAHIAYKSCVAQAHTVNVSDCRVLAGQ